MATIIGLAFAVEKPDAARAANTGPGLVQNIYVQANGIAIFELSGPIAGSWPACATQHRYTVNLGTAGGSAAYASILSAKLAQKPLYVTGAGACPDWADSEAIAYVNVVA